MATKSELYQLVGRAATDPSFQAEAIKDPLAAANKAGVTLDATQKAWVQSNPKQLQNFVKMISANKVTPLDCGNCIVDGH